MGNIFRYCVKKEKSGLLVTHQMISNINKTDENPKTSLTLSSVLSRQLEVLNFLAVLVGTYTCGYHNKHITNQ